MNTMIKLGLYLKMKHKTKVSGVLATLILGFGFLICGVVMIAKDLVAVGINIRTMQESGFGGYLLLLIGIVFLIVTYFSLSPFGRIRKFFEDDSKKRKG